MKKTRKRLGILAMAIGVLGLLPGCYRTGRTIGESLREVEAKIDRFQEGYQDGRYGVSDGPSPFNVLEAPEPDLRFEPMPDTLGIEDPVVPPIPESFKEDIKEPIVPDIPRGS